MRFHAFVPLAVGTQGAGEQYFQRGMVDVQMSSVCELSIIKKAVNMGFLDHIFSTCISPNVDGLNMRGERSLSSGECTVQWIRDNAEENPIPTVGACRTAIDTFVKSVLVVQTDNYLSASPPWLYGFDEHGALNVTDTFIQEVQNHIKADDPYSMPVTERFLGGGDQCSPATVKALASLDAFSRIVRAISSASDPVADLIVGIPNGNALCYDCYHRMFWGISQGFAGLFKMVNDDVDVVCADPTSDLCMRVSPIALSLVNFKICAGYDIFFSGPHCSDSGMHAISQLSPDPYFLFTHCAINPADEICSTIESYLDRISDLADEGCMVCYRDFRNEMVSFADTSENAQACVNNVHAPICIAAAAKPLTNFLACSGFMINGLN
jgi:hypothetical protein